MDILAYIVCAGVVCHLKKQRGVALFVDKGRVVGL